MSRVLLFLCLTIAGFGFSAWAAWHPELWEPALEQLGIERGSRLFDAVLKGFAATIAAAPALALLNAIARLGGDEGRIDIHGYTVVRLRTGTRWFLALAMPALAALFFAMPMIEPERTPWMFRGAGLVVLAFGLLAITAQLRYDGRGLSTYVLLRGWRQFEWADLQEIRDVPQARTVELLFRNGRKASISYRYAGFEALLDTAQARIDAHAGASRGRDGSARS